MDLPVAREAATDYPFLPGSGLKGSLRDKAENGSLGMDRVQQLFGKQDTAGQVLIADGRLLLLPVRSLTGSYRWATCPHLLERYARDLLRVGLGPFPCLDGSPGRGEAWGAAKDQVFLEERLFRLKRALPDGIAPAIEPLIVHEQTRGRLASQIVLLNNDDFAWFARFGLAVQARNVLEDGTKRSTNLWYEETVPPDALFYCVVVSRSAEARDSLEGMFPSSDIWLQVGGNETVGQGWCSVSVRRGGEPR